MRLAAANLIGACFSRLRSHFVIPVVVDHLGLMLSQFCLFKLLLKRIFSVQFLIVATNNVTFCTKPRGSFAKQKDYRTNF